MRYLLMNQRKVLPLVDVLQILLVCSAESACKYYNSDFTTYSQEYKDFLKNFFLAQIDSFEYGKTGAGW
jgi:hypothetical protein